MLPFCLNAFMIEIRHLKTLRALRDRGSLVDAADQLSLTPSALSHQIRDLEAMLDVTLFSRKKRPLQFSSAGLALLTLADDVLPLIMQRMADIKRLANGQAGKLMLASECHSCFDWLMPVLNRYRQSFPDVELDFSAAFEPQPHQMLQEGDYDILITADKIKLPGIQYAKLFDYECRLVISPQHPFNLQTALTVEDIAAQTLICHPVDLERLDIVSQLFQPAGITPDKIRKTQLTQMLIQLVASDHGVAALPDWVVFEYEQKGWVRSRRLPTASGKGIVRTLYAGYRTDHADQAFFAEFLAHLTKFARQRDQYYLA
jgi:LysR family transcriptional regulator for metE and metH